MGEVIKTIRRNCYLLLLASCFLMSCSSYGTEVGNPGQRNVTGNLETTTSDLITASLTTQQYTTVNSTSCPSSNGDITVGLRNRDGSITSQSLDDGFSFLTEIDEEDRYEVLFLQNDEICGYLTYASGEPQHGLRVTLGRGDEDITLGEISDLGNGIFVSENNPSNFCDDDGDGANDRDDDDDDGDGHEDRDEVFDGYLDWFDNDDDGDGVDDEDDEDEDEDGDGISDDEDEDDDGDGINDEDEDEECDVEHIYPSETSGLFLDSSHDGEILIFMTAAITSVDGSLFSILNVEGEVVFDGIDEGDLEIDDDLLVIMVNLEPDREHTLVIEEDAIACDTGDSYDDDIEIEFFTID